MASIRGCFCQYAQSTINSVEGVRKMVSKEQIESQLVDMLDILELDSKGICHFCSKDCEYKGLIYGKRGKKNNCFKFTFRNDIKVKS